ncbi:hypothetical protein [Pseudolysinimonas sp.]|uniref:hypothetical protein n=1 Tax=Pseudolysinimonas sp. TaxID=2680009 RepID=UPI003267B150
MIPFANDSEVGILFGGIIPPGPHTHPPFGNGSSNRKAGKPWDVRYALMPAAT